MPIGEIGIAFGDVSGHGLTSGIVMAMAKAALLVQVDYDASPRAVMNVLNDIVMRTAPRRILMTFFFGLLDPPRQTLRFSSAGPSRSVRLPRRGRNASRPCRRGASRSASAGASRSASTG